MSKFPWGKVVDRFDYDFDGEKLEVVKYLPRKAMHLNGGYEERPQYHVEELHSSYWNMQALLIDWIAYKNLGLNQHSLTAGLCKALEIKGE